MAVSHARVSPEVELAWEGFGDRGAPILLIMGLGSQMLLWHEDFCAALAARGHRVVRFDNRDVGLSTRMSHLKPPSLRRILASGAAGPARFPTRAPYLLADMAEDARGLLDALGWDRAHVVGSSMGGMIAQELALRHPDRVASLTSIMSTPKPAIPSPRGLSVLVVPPKKGREIEHFVWAYTRIGGPHMRDDGDRLRDVARRSLERGASPSGFLRQLAAVVASGDRSDRLRASNVPSLVIHGAVDPLVHPSLGRRTAELLRARFVLHPDQGHDLARALWPRLIGDISDHVASVEGRR